jgi:tRNA threonylcarbamoyladenosine biosynthesis protein TsaE
VKSGRQPVPKAAFGVRKVDTGHPDLGESEFLAPGLQARDELSSDKTGLHGTPIVGSHPVGSASGSSSPAAWQGRWQAEEDTAAFASKLAACPALADAVIALHGDLGAGKTTLVRHLLRTLGVEGRIKSPTYTVVEPHTSSGCSWMPEGEPLAIWHFDFYRFTDPREWEDAGFRELFAAPGLKLVEWPERAAGVMPVADLEIDIRAEHPPMTAHPDPHLDEHRRVKVQAGTTRGQQLLEALA